jgi:hypothetical protein
MTDWISWLLLRFWCFLPSFSFFFGNFFDLANWPLLPAAMLGAATPYAPRAVAGKTLSFLFLSVVL